jgi:hypothetical protein
LTVTDSRRVKTLRLRAPSDQLVRRGAVLLEDALRIATVPRSSPGHILIVKTLKVGRIDTRQSSATVALTLENALRGESIAALYGGEEAAPEAQAVFFHDEVDPFICLAVRVARGKTAGAWFWPLALHWKPESLSQSGLLRRLLFGAARTTPGTAAVVRLVSGLNRAGLASELLLSIKQEDGPFLARSMGILPADAEGEPRELQAPHNAHALRSSWRSLLHHFVALWGANDPRSPWLAAVALVADNPHRLEDSRLPVVAQDLVRHIDAMFASRPAPKGSAHGGEVKPAAVARSDDKKEAGSPELFARLPDPTRPADPAVERISEVEDSVQPLQAYSRDHQSVPNEGTLKPNVNKPSFVKNTPDRVPLSYGVETESIATYSGENEADERRSGLVAFESFQTGCGGLFFLIPLLARLEFGPYLKVHPHLLEFNLPWKLLRSVCLRTGDSTDPLLVVLADAAGENSHDVIIAEELRAWRSRIRRWCRANVKIGVHALVRREGRIATTPTHIDVYLRHRWTDIRIRKTGLDLDQGWVPWLGRVVTYHYVSEGEAEGA